MKCNMAFFSFIISLFIHFTTFAKPVTVGFNGEISLLSLAISTDSNLSSLSDSKRNASELNTQGETEFRFIPAILGNASYNYGEQLEHQLFFGTSREDIAVGTLALEVGYQYTFDSNSRISVSYLPTLIKEDVWSDPFVINAEREETQKEGNAYRLEWKQIFNTPLSIDLAYANENIQHDKSGEALELTQAQQHLLERSSENYYAELSYRQFLGRGLGITPAFSYLVSNADGESVSYNQFGAKISYFSFANRNKAVASLSYQGRIYDALHPIFNQQREDHEFRLFLVYEYSEFLNIPSFSFVSLNGISLNNSNIDFYSDKQFITSLGVTYRF